MSMFLADAAFALELLALVAGSYLLIKSYEQIPAKRFIKFVSFFVIIFSFLGMLCTSIFVVRELMHGCCKTMNQKESSGCQMQMRNMMENQENNKNQDMQPGQMKQHMDDIKKQEN